MKKDIKTREDIYLLVKNFYKKLLSDVEIHHFFSKFSNEEVLENHLQTLVDFWDNILFYTGAYKKNAMKPHLDLHLEKPFKKEHFDRWLLHFNATIDENFIGDISHAAKSRALSIATVMQIKISELNKK